MAGARTSVIRADGLVVWLDPRPLLDTAVGPRLRVTVGGSCPATDGGIVGVRNPGQPDLRGRLLPRSVEPTGGLVCRYDGMNGRPFMLRRQTRLTEAEARRLAAVVDALPLSHLDGGVAHCPAADGTAAVLALAYPGRPDVDLWADLNGCATVANGDILTAGNLSQAIDGVAQSGVSPVVPAPGTPSVVWRTALALSRRSMREPHPLVEALWVISTWAEWDRLRKEPAPTGRLGAVRVYVVEIKSPRPLVCLSCSDQGPAPTGRYAFAIFPVVGTAGGSEGSLTNTDYPLARIGTVHVAAAELR